MEIHFTFCYYYYQRLLLLTVAVVAAVNADVSHLFHDSSQEGYFYPKPDKKLCPDGTVRVNCDERPEPPPPQVCPPGSPGEFLPLISLFILLNSEHTIGEFQTDESVI